MDYPKKLTPHRNIAHIGTESQRSLSSEALKTAGRDVIQISRFREKDTPFSPYFNVQDAQGKHNFRQLNLDMST